MVALLLLTGCGDEDLPDGVAAQVGTQRITEPEVARAVVGRIAFSHSAETLPAYFPNDVEACVAAQRARLAKRGASRDDIEDRCRGIRDRHQDAALRLLIQIRWYELEARDRGLKVPTPRSAISFASSHSQISPRYFGAVVRASLLRELVGPRYPDESAFSSDELLRYYRSHRNRYVSEDRRYIQALIVREHSQAQRVETRLQRGRSPERIAQSLKGQGVRLAFAGPQITVTAGGAELQRAARHLPEGATGMLRDPRGWYVFRVETVLPPRQETFNEAHVRILQELQAKLMRKRVEAFNAKLRSKYQDETVCAEDHRVPDCK